MMKMYLVPDFLSTYDISCCSIIGIRQSQLHYCMTRALDGGGGGGF